MLKWRQLTFSPHGALYELIPEDHLLKRVGALVDFSFANEKFADSYCQHYGRPAKEPELMLRLLFLQYLYDLSDEQVMSDAQVNLAYKWFAGLNPEDVLPDPSCRSRFRTQRVARSKESAQQILDAVVQQCVEREEKRLIVDATTITGQPGVTSFFDPTLCASCSMRDGCYNGQKIGKSVTVSEPNAAQEAAKQRQQSDEGKAIYRRRGVIEHKLAELKRFSGMRRARYRSLLRVLQAIMACVVATPSEW